MRERHTSDRAFPLLIRAEEILQDMIEFLAGDPEPKAITLVDRADSLLVEIAFALAPQTLTKDQKDH